MRSSLHLAAVLATIAALPLATSLSHEEDVRLLHSGRPQIGLWKALYQQAKSSAPLKASILGPSSQTTFSSLNSGGGGGGSEDNPAEDPTKYTPHCFTQPLDHFNPQNNITFCQRYWVSLSHWNSSNPSAPVIILDGGETSGSNRLAFLESGIINILTNATGGIGVILEHRYYGDSLPEVSYPDYTNMTLGTDDLRWLTNEQAEMDNVRFLQGLDLSHLIVDPETKAEVEVTGADGKKGKSHPIGAALGFDAMRADTRPYIYYGGSYAGARAAHMIKGFGYNGDQLHTVPPPHPSIEWQTKHLPPAPSHGKVTLPGGSTIIINSTTGSTGTEDASKGLIWGSIASSAVTHAQIRYPEYFQAIQDWAPSECMRTLEDVIETLDDLLSIRSGILAPRLKSLFGLADLEHTDDFMEVLASPLGGWQSRNWDNSVGSEEFYRFCEALTSGGAGGDIGLVKIPAGIMNYAKWVREEVVERCPVGEDGVRDVEACFGSYDEESYLQTGLDQTWRLWLFQVATQWGYYMPAPLEGKRIISKFLDLDYTMKNGRMAFPPGKYFTVPEFPDVASVNARGDFDLTFDRLAFIDGDSDPWRPATPGSDFAQVRNDTITRPVRIIKDAVHHFDENGLLDPSEEPERIREIHEYEIEFVRSWLEDWQVAKAAGKV